MFKGFHFFLILLLFSSTQAKENLNIQTTENLKILNLPISMEQEVQKIINSKKIEQKQFLAFIKNKALQGGSSFVLEFPFYHINTKLKNSNWTSLTKSQIYFLALKEARHQVSQVLFSLVLKKDKIKFLKKRLQSIIDKKAKYYIFSEKVFKFHVNSKFSFISTAKVHLKISFLNLKKILDKEGLLHNIKDKFNILPMFNLLNTKTGYAKNWWQSNTQFLSRSTKGSTKGFTEGAAEGSAETQDISLLNKETGLDRLMNNLKSQFLSHFAEQAKPLSLYLFRPTRFDFQQFLPKPLLKKSSFYPVKIASYLKPDLILSGEIAYSLDEQKRILKALLLLKVFKSSNKKIVVVFSKEKKWTLEPAKEFKKNSKPLPMQINYKIKRQILDFFKKSGNIVLKELVGMKNKALLQAYEIVLVVKGFLIPSDLYQFMSIFKFHVREVLDIQVQALSQSEFHLKLVSTLKPKEIVEKIKNLNLSNYEIKAVSLFSDNSKLSFFLRKRNNK